MADTPNTKTKAQETLDRLPESANWDDVMYELYVREAIDAGMADVAAGRTLTHAEVRAQARGSVLGARRTRRRVSGVRPSRYRGGSPDDP